MNINLTLFVQSLVFFLFVLFCWQFIWPPIIKAINERKKMIQDGLASAKKASDDLVIAKKQAQEHLKDAQAEAAQLLERAKERSKQIVDEAAHQAKAEADRIKAQAKVDLDTECTQVKEGLREQLSELVIEGVNRILDAPVDKKQHEKILSQLATELK